MNHTGTVKNLQEQLRTSGQKGIMSMREDIMSYHGGLDPQFKKKVDAAKDERWLKLKTEGESRDRREEISERDVSESLEEEGG